MSHEIGVEVAQSLASHACGRCLTQRLHLPLASGVAEVDLEESLMRLVDICHAYDSGEIDPDWDAKPGEVRPDCAFPARPTGLCPFNYVEHNQTRSTVREA
jgi:hypothetical protein